MRSCKEFNHSKFQFHRKFPSHDCGLNVQYFDGRFTSTSDDGLSFIVWLRSRARSRIVYAADIFIFLFFQFVKDLLPARCVFQFALFLGQVFIFSRWLGYISILYVHTVIHVQRRWIFEYATVQLRARFYCASQSCVLHKHAEPENDSVAILPRCANTYTYMYTYLWAIPNGGHDISENNSRFAKNIDSETLAYPQCM